MATGKFDVFLSYAWGANDKRQPLATEIYKELTALGYRVWIDIIEMKNKIDKSMTEGIDNSRIIVILLSPDYAAKENCMTEIKHTVASDKPYFVCMVEPGFWKTWAHPHPKNVNQPELSIPFNHEIIAPPPLGLGVDLKLTMWADMGDASTVDWTAQNVSDVDRKKLIEKREALPLLRKFLKDEVSLY